MTEQTQPDMFYGNDPNEGFSLFGENEIQWLSTLDGLELEQRKNEFCKTYKINTFQAEKLINRAKLEREAELSKKKPPNIKELQISPDELQAARITPTCIVDKYLYADVGVLSAPGGTGKTTLILHEMINIALGRPVHNLNVEKPGICLLITKEDRKEQCTARLREITQAMELTDAETKTVLDNVLIWDLTGESLRLVQNVGGNLVTSVLAELIIDIFTDTKPVLITFDPSISFGVSEALINDNEQGIIEACRKIVRSLDCCVRMVTHTGKAVAREKSLDQYSSRGGSALPDGSRMTTVMQPWKPGDKEKPPPECAVDDTSSLSILARPKLSYAPRNLPNIWVKRTGWNFESFTEIKQSEEERQAATEQQIIQFLKTAVNNGERHTKTSLVEAIKTKTTIKRDDARSIIEILMAQYKIIESELPENEKKRNKTTFLAPAGFRTV